MIVEPYVYVRALTLSLGTLWTLFGILRMRRFFLMWRARLVPLGFDEGWLRDQVLIFTLRVTLLDPWNLALMLLLVFVWILRATL